MSDRKRPVIPYDERIIALTKFFGISHACAGFLYHRRRRGKPFKDAADPKYLGWSFRLQNALVKADACIGWDWSRVHFGTEDAELAKYDIHVDQQTDVVYRNIAPESEDADGWSVVKRDKQEKSRYARIVQTIGFGQYRALPRKPLEYTPTQ